MCRHPGLQVPRAPPREEAGSDALSGEDQRVLAGAGLLRGRRGRDRELPLPASGCGRVRLPLHGISPGAGVLHVHLLVRVLSSFLFIFCLMLLTLLACAMMMSDVQTLGVRLMSNAWRLDVQFAVADVQRVLGKLSKALGGKLEEVRGYFARNDPQDSGVVPFEQLRSLMRQLGDFVEHEVITIGRYFSDRAGEQLDRTEVMATAQHQLRMKNYEQLDGLKMALEQRDKNKCVLCSALERHCSSLPYLFALCPQERLPARERRASSFQVSVGAHRQRRAQRSH